MFLVFIYLYCMGKKQQQQNKQMLGQGLEQHEGK